MRAVTLARARAFLAAKQHLATPSRDNLLDVLDSVVEVYGTARSCYFSLAARSDRSVRTELDRELYVAHRIIRLRCMRSSAYAVSARLLPEVMVATRPNVERVMNGFMRAYGVSPATIETVEEGIVAALRGGNTMTVAELKKTVEHLPDLGPPFQRVVALLCARGVLVRARPRGSWRSDSFEYALFEQWAQEVDLDISHDEGCMRLLRLYLRGYGPATTTDFE